MAKKFKKGDLIQVISGNDRGKTGKIIAISGSKATIEGINIATIHKSPTSKEPGQIIKKEKPIDISKISHTENGKKIKIKFTIEMGEGKPFSRKKRVSKITDKKIN